MDKNKTITNAIPDFPFEDLKVEISRRDFFSTIFTEFHLRANRRYGALGIKISSLGKMEPEKLGEFIPVIVPDCEIELKSQSVWAVLKQKNKKVFLFDIDPISLYAFNQFNGQTPLKDIARNISNKFSLDAEYSFRIARGLFLTLVKAGASLPANNPFLG
ncbi:MAG TPA: hypothetical protein VHO90_16280 [Bacteroidales bacterium]|nr:hypothetical protein [Bacteroidales bacterium]